METSEHKMIRVLQIRIITNNLEDPEGIGKRKFSCHPSDFDHVLMICVSDLVVRIHPAHGNFKNSVPLGLGYNKHIVCKDRRYFIADFLS